MKVGVPSSAFFCPTVFQSLQCESCSRERVRCGHSLVAQALSSAPSRTTWGLLGQPEAQAGKRKPPPPVEKKVEEDKGLSAYDQKLLASTHRKEARRLSIEGQKAKGKSLASNP
ncbi:unnamed protein product [Sphagnum troendelagicum]|uniref:Uncharacterized protein n=1 Tax=Sphagnum troendelagicum TaxID=128251 RepID=A0ABP0V1W7_9BRYO